MAEPVRSPVRTAQIGVIAAVLISTATAIYYRVIRQEELTHTAALFIGLPAILAFLLVLLPRAKSATGAILKGITFALLIVAPLLGEGMICILVASPLFYLIGGLVGQAVDYNRRKRNITLSCCALVLLPMSLEGVVPRLTFNRLQSVVVTRTVNASSDEVEAALSRGPRVESSLPLFLRIGFPRPLAASGAGLAVGSLRVVHFTGAEGAPPGDLVVRVTASRPGYLRTETVSDRTKLAQWLCWRSSEVSWRRLDATHTEVAWRIDFERRLDPAWYFTPWQRVAVQQAAAYLIATNATPAGRR